ncbi:hypothetical protein ACP70R_024667 [Stipagrostis hirtigluma subsp. patula]
MAELLNIALAAKGLLNGKLLGGNAHLERPLLDSLVIE